MFFKQTIWVAEWLLRSCPGGLRQPDPRSPYGPVTTGYGWAGSGLADKAAGASAGYNRRAGAAMFCGLRQAQPSLEAVRHQGFGVTGADLDGGEG